MFFKDIKHYIKDFKLADDDSPEFTSLVFAELITRWNEIAGQFLANHSIPYRLNYDILSIAVNHPLMGQEIMYMQDKLIAEIKKKFPNFKKIKGLKSSYLPQVFEKLEEVKKKEEQKVTLPHPQSPQYRKLSQEAKEIIGNLDDTDLEKILESIYIQSKTLK